MSGAPGVEAIASIEGELAEINQLLDGLKAAGETAGIGEDIGGEYERDILQTVLLLEIARSIGGISVGGGGTTVVGGGSGTAPAPGQPDVNVDTGGEAIVAALEADIVVSSLDQQVGADSDILNQDIEPAGDPSVYRVTAAFDAEVALSVVFNDGSNEETVALNQGDTLGADALYSFDVTGVNSDLQVNFQSDTQASARVFIVKELSAAAP